MTAASSSLRPGAWVLWLPDHDEGLVTGLIPGQSIAIRWASTGHVEWYPLDSVAVQERLEPFEPDTADETPF